MRNDSTRHRARVRRMKGYFSPWALAAFLAASSPSCVSEVQPRQVPPPLLRCALSSECRSMDQNAFCASDGVCRVSVGTTRTDHVLVVSVPEFAYSAAGALMLLPQSEWNFVPSVSCPQEDCLRLPSVVRARTRVVLAEAPEALHPSLQGELGAVVPADVAYVPRMRVNRDGKSYVYDAAALGLPATPLRTVPVVPKTQGLRGVFGAVATDALAYLPSNATYARRVMPAVWLAPLIPPHQDSVVDASALEDEGVATLPFGAREIPIDPPISFSLSYDSSWRGGVRVAMYDAVTDSRLSTDAVAEACPPGPACTRTIALRSVAGLLARSLLAKLRVSPLESPPGLDVRYSVYSALGSVADLALPGIPSTAEIHLEVQGPLGEAVSAAVSVRRAADSTSESLEVRADASLPGSPLLMPEGVYNVHVLPGDGVHSTAVRTEAIVANGKNSLVVRVAQKPLFQGRIVDASGNPVVGASIRAASAANGDEEARISQLATAASGADGRFSLRLDAGRYGLRIVAPAWTRLGELSVYNVVSGETNSQIPDIIWPVPKRMSMHLTDANGLAVSRAGMLVRMFEQVGGSGVPHYEPVAAGRSDESGFVQLEWASIAKP